jgi:hypothetical protein
MCLQSETETKTGVMTPFETRPQMRVKQKNRNGSPTSPGRFEYPARDRRCRQLRPEIAVHHLIDCPVGGDPDEGKTYS